MARTISIGAQKKNILTGFLLNMDDSDIALFLHRLCDYMSRYYNPMNSYEKFTLF